MAREGGWIVHGESLDLPSVRVIVNFSGNSERKWPQHRKAASVSERLNST